MCCKSPDNKWRLHSRAEVVLRRTWHRHSSMDRKELSLTVTLLFNGMNDCNLADVSRWHYMTFTIHKWLQPCFVCRKITTRAQTISRNTHADLRFFPIWGRCSQRLLPRITFLIHNLQILYMMRKWGHCAKFRTQSYWLHSHNGPWHKQVTAGGHWIVWEYWPLVMQGRTEAKPSRERQWRKFK